MDRTSGQDSMKPKILKVSRIQEQGIHGQQYLNLYRLWSFKSLFCDSQETHPRDPKHDEVFIELG